MDEYRAEMLPRYSRGRRHRGVGDSSPSDRASRSHWRSVTFSECLLLSDCFSGWPECLSRVPKLPQVEALEVGGFHCPYNSQPVEKLPYSAAASPPPQCRKKPLPGCSPERASSPAKFWRMSCA